MRLSRRLAFASVLFAACHPAATRSTAAPDYIEERGGDREAVLLSAWRPTPPQKCQLSRYPQTLPAPESLISIAAMPIMLQQAGIAKARGTALVSLKFDSSGRVQRARVIEGTLPDEQARALEQVVVVATEPQPAGREWGARLLIELDSVPRYRVGRSEHCAAVPAPAQAQSSAAPPVTERVSGVVAVPAGSTPARAASISPTSKRTFYLKYLIAVNARGEVVEVKETGASSESASFLEAHRAKLARERWLPELDDRVPVAAVVERTERLQSSLVAVP